MARGRAGGKLRRAGMLLAVAVALAVVPIFGPTIAVRLAGGGSFTIPGAAMAPALVPGDRLLALPLGRDLPARGAVVIFEHPRKPGVTYVKRLIGHPGETVQLSGGVVHVDGMAAGMERLADRVMPMRPQGRPPMRPRCRNAPVAPGGDCLQERWRETLPDGTAQVVLNLNGIIGDTSSPRYANADNTRVFTVPAGHVFVLGDNRDNSVDSRFDDMGMVPAGNLRHVAWRILASFDWSQSLPRPRLGRFFARVL